MMTTDKTMNRLATRFVCRVVREEGCREASPYPDYKANHQNMRYMDIEYANHK